MAKRKQRAEMGFKQASTGLVGGAVILGVGADVAVKAGGSGAGMGAAASFMPAMGATMGAGMTLQEVRKLQKVSKKKRR